MDRLRREKNKMFRVLKKFNYILDRRRRMMVGLLLILMVIGATLEVVGISMMIPILMAVMEPEFIETNGYAIAICRVLDLHSYRTFAIACIGVLIIIYIGKDLFLILEYYAQARFVCNNRFLLQKRVFEAYMKRPYEYFLQAKTGEITRTVSGDVTQTFELLWTLLNLATESIVSSSLIAAIFIMDPLITTAVGVIMGITMMALNRIAKPILQNVSREEQKHSAYAFQWIQQAIAGIKEVKVTRTREYFEKNYQESSLQMAKAQRKTTLLSNVPRLIIEMVSVSSMLALIAILILRGQEITSLVTTVGVVGLAAVRLLPSANRITAALNAISYHELALDRVIENLRVLKEDNREREPDGHPGIKLAFQKDIVLEHVTYSYEGTEEPVLSDACMVIPKGKSVGIVGTSGAGKTTAVDLLLGLLRPQKGKVLLDGVDILTGYDSWLSYIGYIPQSIFMLDGSIRENIEFGHNDTNNDEQIWRALEEAQLADFVRNLPKGLDTEIGERGVRVSGGQRQRIGIARALYTNPEILVFDEATSALDNETEEAIMESINAFQGRKTMIIIAHRLTTIKECNIVYRVEHGKIVKERESLT